MSIEDILSALAFTRARVKGMNDVYYDKFDESKINKFNEHVVSTLLNEFTTSKPNNYNKYIKEDILSPDLRDDFKSGINVDEVKKYILDPSKIDMKDIFITTKVFTDKFLNKYLGDITTWGREILQTNNINQISFSPITKRSLGGNESLKKKRKIHNKTHRKK